MAKKKFIKCFCSSVGKPTNSNFGFSEFSTYGDKCECRVDGKRMTKHGRDDIAVEVIKSKRKGYEWS
jgi:hypothetical protein